MIIWPSFHLVSRCQKKRKSVSTCFPDAIDSSEKSQRRCCYANDIGDNDDDFLYWHLTT